MKKDQEGNGLKVKGGGSKSREIHMVSERESEANDIVLGVNYHKEGQVLISSSDGMVRK